MSYMVFFALNLHCVGQLSLLFAFPLFFKNVCKYLFAYNLISNITKVLEIFNQFEKNYDFH